MPYSTSYFKPETIHYILGTCTPTANILDIGAGSGTYSDLLKPHGFMNIDCVEVFSDYITQFGLDKKYRKVINEDIGKATINFSEYDLIIMGDVLEHLSVSDAKIVLNKMDECNVIIAVPFESPQGESFGNIHEVHIQHDLTLTGFLHNYSGFRPLCLRYDYGVFVKKPTGVLYIEDGEEPLPSSYLDVIRPYSKEVEIINISES